MQDKIQQLGKHKNSRIQLVSGLAAGRILLGTPAIQWYLAHGLVIMKVYQAIEFRGEPILNNLVMKLTNTRPQAPHTVRQDDPGCGQDQDASVGVRFLGIVPAGG